MALHATVAYRVEAWRSGILDFKSASSTEIIPARGSYRFMPLRAWVEFTSYASVSTGFIFTLGNNPTTYNNVHQGSTEVAGVLRQIVPITLFVSGGRLTVDMGSTGIFAKITTAATATACSGVIVIEGYFYPYGT